MKPICILLVSCAAAMAQSPNPLTDAVMNRYKGIRQNLIESAEVMPEEGYSFRLTPPQRPFGEWIGHVAMGNYNFCGVIKGEKPPDTHHLHALTGKAELSKALVESFEYCDGALKGMDDRKAMAEVSVGDKKVYPVQGMVNLVAEAKKRGAAEVPFFSDYHKMLDEVRPDFVWAFVENNRHLEIVEACAPKKIHVIFEKPLAATYSDALAIRRLANEHGIQVMTNYQMAWWPANYAAKAKVDEGALGQVWRLHGIVGHGGPGKPEGLNKYFFDWLTDPVKNGAGALMDFGCYNALWSLWYFGRPEKVYAQVNHLRPQTFPKVEDNADLPLSYRDGAGLFEA